MSAPTRLPRVRTGIRGALLDAYDEFVVTALRDGRLRLRGLTPPQRAIGIGGSVLVLAVSVAMLASDMWRSGPGRAVPAGPAGRGIVVPDALVPVTLFLLAVSTAMVLAGACRAAAAVKWPVLVVYVALAGFFVDTALVDASAATAWIARGGIVAAVGWFITTVWTSRRPALDLVVLLACTSATFIASYDALLDLDDAAATGLGAGALRVSLIQATALTFPMLLLAGLSVVSFGASVATWGVGVAERHAGTWAIGFGVVALGAWRTRDLVIESRAVGGDLLEPLVGAVVLLVAVAIPWLVITHRRTAGGGHGEIAELPSEASRHAMVLVVLQPLVAVLAAVALLLATGAAGIVPESSAGDVLELGTDAVDALTSDGATDATRIGFGLVALALALLLARRGRHTAAGWVATVGVVGIANWAFGAEGPLRTWAWTELAVDVVIVAVLAVTVLVLAVRRELSVRRLEWIAFVLLLTALLRQGGFLADPFAPLLGFAGIGFVLFGILWGFATGGAWANADSTTVPRTSRVALLLGYELFSLTVLLWFAATHETTSVTTLSATAEVGGYRFFGVPLLFALIAVAMRAIVRDEAIAGPSGRTDEEPECVPP